MRKVKTARVPVIMQMEAVECGAACLAMILAHYGKWISLSQLRGECGVSRDGSNAYNVIKVARSYGLTANGYRYSAQRFFEAATFPCVVFWNSDHFLVVRGYKGKKVFINDPARGAYTVSVEEFCECYSGICLSFCASSEFEKSGKPSGILAFARERLKGAAGLMTLIAAAGIGTTIVGVLWSASSRVFADNLLSGMNRSWHDDFFWLLALLVALQAALSILSALSVKAVNGKMGVTSNALFFWHMLHLPIDFFLQRKIGDLIQRQNTNESIAQTLTASLAPLLMNLLMLVFYVVIMLGYSVPLALIGIGSSLINLYIVQYSSKKRLNIMRVQSRDIGRLVGETMAGVRVIETLKATGAESGWFRHWGDTQAAVNTSRGKFTRINVSLGILPSFFENLANIAILLFGALLIMENNFTIGMLLAFQGFMGAFIAPVNGLLDAGQNIQEMRTDMERVNDIMDYPSDPNCAEEAPFTASHKADAGVVYDKLKGGVTLKNVFFGYSKLEEPLIQDFSAEIKAGQRVAIVGASGCGKSTVSRLISGLYLPRSGEILFDGKPRREYPREVMCGSMLVVDQDITLFEDTIANNLKLWDSAITDTDMINAARDAAIYDDIMAMEGGFEHRLREGGQDLSGGQRQRLEIARALACNPTLLILDEATGALDAQTEAHVVSAISARGVTCIIIAHRLSTIRDCDEIILLDHGKIAEKGTHSELLALGGLYRRLVTSD